MTPLRQQMHDAMLVRGLAERTRQTYIENVARLAIFYHRNPADLTPEQVESWLLHLVRDRKLSYSTLNQAAAACRFFYGTVLKRERAVFPVPMAQTPQRQPELLARAELAALFASAASFQSRIMLQTTYAAGLRVSEACALRIADPSTDSGQASTAIRTGCACGFAKARAGRIAIPCCRLPCWKPCATIGAPTIPRNGCFRAVTVLAR